jgi:hypothetical protein
MENIPDINLNKNKTKARRFELPVQEEAKERLDGFRTSVKELQGENPEVLGATVYGSMIKGGQARFDSDVDAFLYIDAEKITNSDADPNEYRMKLFEKLGIDNNDEQSKFYEDLRPQLLSSEIINKEIEDQLGYYNESEKYNKMLGEKYGEASEEEKELLLKQEPDFRTIQFGISGMFHARVGSGLEKYRKIFLEKIATLPDKTKAEKLWGEVASDIRTFEKRSDPNIQIETPDTLNEALIKYDPEFYSDIIKKEDQEELNKTRQELKDLIHE